MWYFSLTYQHTEKGWRPECLYSIQVQHKHYFKILTGTKWACTHSACPLHLGYSGTQCVEIFRHSLRGFLFPLSDWIFKQPLKDENPSLPLPFQKILPTKQRVPRPFLLSHPQIPKMLYDRFEETFVCSDCVLLVRKEPCAHLSLVFPIGVWSFSVLEVNSKV